MKWNARSVIPLTAVVVLSFAFAGIAGPAHLGMMQDGQMDTCPFAQSAGCTMDAIGHISEWQALFVATAQTFGAFSVALAMAALYFAAAASRARPVRSLLLSQHLQARWRVRRRLSPSIRGPLHFALVRGILNPKPF